METNEHPYPTQQEYHCYDCFLALNPAPKPNLATNKDPKPQFPHTMADLQRKVDRLERELKEESELTADLMQCLYDKPHAPGRSDLPTSVLLDTLLGRVSWRTEIYDPCPLLSNGMIRKEILSRCLS